MRLQTLPDQVRGRYTLVETEDMARRRARERSRWLAKFHECSTYRHRLTDAQVAAFIADGITPHEAAAMYEEDQDR